MKYQEKYAVTRGQCFSELKELLAKLSKERLEIEGVNVEIPYDKEIILKVKYEDNPEEGQLAIKVAWNNFKNLAPSYRKRYVLWLTTAKRAATKEKRLEEAIDLLENNEKLGMK